MSDEMIMLATWVVAGLVSVTVCGIVSAAAGTSFWWGFWFGPLGILISVVRRMSAERPRVVVIGGGGGVRTRTRIAQRATREPTEVERFNAWFDAQGRQTK